MLSGSPLVDFDVTGLRNIFGGEDHFVGFADMSEATRGIKNLLENETLAAEIGHRARENVLARHMSTHRAETFCDFVEEILQAKQPQREPKQPSASFLNRAVPLPHPISLGW
jgi:spore maturation protein CgeB